MSFGQDTTGFIISNLATYTELISHALSASWPAVAFTALYIVVCGYMIIVGNAGKHAKDLAVSMVLLVVLQGVIGSGFNEWVARPFLDTVQGLSQLALNPSGNGDTDVFIQLDDGLGQIMTTINRLEPPGNLITAAWMYIKVGVVSLVLAVAYGLLYVVFLVLYIVALFSIYMMLMVGGIFLWLGAFKVTRSYTLAWFRALLNYGLWVFFLSIVIGFFMGVVMAYVHDLAQWDLADEGPFPASAGKLIFFCLLVAWLLLKTADWSAQLTGGTAMSPGIVTSGASLVGSAIGSAARSAPAKAAGAWAAGGAWSIARGTAARAFSALKGVK